LTRQFDHDSEINGYPFHHGYELKASSDGIKIAGGSMLAQQVIVVPKDKWKQQNITNDDYGGNKLLDKDVFSELLLEPQEVGIWDGAVFKTASGGSRKEEIITPRDGGKWKHGDYIVVISAGWKLNRKSEKQPYGAMDINLANNLTDALTMLGAINSQNANTQKVKEVSTNLGAIASDCYTSKDDYLELLPCVQKPDNMSKIIAAGASLGDFNNEDMFKYAFKTIADRDLAKLAKIGMKGVSKASYFLDYSTAASRNTVLHDYLYREIQNGFYFAEISIIDPVVLASAPITIVLGDAERTKEILDMTIKLDDVEMYVFDVKNYSNYPVEIQSEGADSFLVKPNDVESRSQTFRFYGKANTITVRKTVFGPTLKYPLIVGRLNTRLPEKEITFSCDATNLPVTWGLKIKPKCLESGTYAEYENYGMHPLDIIFGNDTISLKGVPRATFFVPASGTLRSSSKTVTLKIRANLNSKTENIF